MPSGELVTLLPLQAGPAFPLARPLCKGTSVFGSSSLDCPLDKDVRFSGRLVRASGVELLVNVDARLVAFSSLTWRLLHRRRGVSLPYFPYGRVAVPSFPPSFFSPVSYGTKNSICGLQNYQMTFPPCRPFSPFPLLKVVTPVFFPAPLAKAPRRYQSVISMLLESVIGPPFRFLLPGVLCFCS